MTFPEDLFGLVVQADRELRRRQGALPQRFRPWQRVWLEPPANFAGLVAGRMWACLPFSWRRSLDLLLCRAISRHPPDYSPDFQERLAEAVTLAARLKADTGRPPAVLALTTHPVTTGPLQWLRFEVIAQGLEAAYAVAADQGRGGARRAPQCVLAIDPYALDSVPAMVGAFYAAFMHQMFMVWDRQPSTQSWVQRTLLLRGTAKPVGWRFIRTLRHGTGLVMALAGGVPVTARLLYASREWVHRWPVERWPRAKREVECQVMNLVLAGGEEPLSTGKLAPHTREALGLLLTELHVPPARAQTLLDEFAQEFAREVPFRERLMRVALKRLSRGGQALLVIPVTHSERPLPAARFAPPIGLHAQVDGQFRWLQDGSPAWIGSLQQVVSRLGDLWA